MTKDEARRIAKRIVDRLGYDWDEIDRIAGIIEFETMTLFWCSLEVRAPDGRWINSLRFPENVAVEFCQSGEGPHPGKGK